jgi:nucleoside-diphosphate-sugar epimerase
MSSKPNVLIFGGLNTVARALASYLVSLEGDSLVNHLRIVDKYSISPPTTYIGAEFPKVVEQPNVEYRQANLSIATTVASMFDPPEGEAPYSYVFDLSGEIRWDRSREVHINNTCNIARLIGTEAARRGVKAYVRLQHPFYTTDKTPAQEKDDIKPEGTYGIWWHETLRILGAIKDLNLVILRTAHSYGPYQTEMISGIFVISSVYAYMKKPMKSLWSPGKHLHNVVHNKDVAGGLWTCAEWMNKVGGREKADEIAGEEIYWHNDKKMVENVPGMVGPDVKVKAPLFNLSGNPDLTFNDLMKTSTTALGTTLGYHDFLTNTAAKFKLDDLVEDINEEHVGTWTTMITSSTPPYRTRRSARIWISICWRNILLVSPIRKLRKFWAMSSKSQSSTPK